MNLRRVPWGLLALALVLVLIGSVSGESWVARSSMPTPRAELAVASDGTRLFFVGGAVEPGVVTAANEVYDPKADEWTMGALMPTPRSDLGVAYVNGNIYAIGGSATGSVSFDVNEAYGLATNRWEVRAPMPTPRHGFGLAVVNGKVYVIGGYSPQTDMKTTLATNEEYDPTLDEWAVRSPMPTPRRGLAAVAVNGLIYAIGGQSHNGDFVPLATVQVYDPSSDAWRNATSMPTPRIGMAAVVFGEKIVVIGGFVCCNTPDRALDTVEIYDPQTDTWSSGVPLPHERGFLSAGVVDGRLFAVGGYYLSGKSPVILDLNEELRSAPEVTTLARTQTGEASLTGSAQTWEVDAWSSVWMIAGALVVAGVLVTSYRKVVNRERKDTYGKS